MIKKYGIITNYGFGFIDEFHVPYITNCAHINISGYNGWRGGTSINIGENEITLPLKDSRRLHPSVSYSKEPIPAILENGIWKEYFTGTPLKFMELPTERNCFELSDNDPEAFNRAKNAGIREFVILDPIQIIPAQRFAEIVARYTEKDIQQIATQLNDLQKKAKQWGPKYEQNLAEFVNGWNKKTADSLRNLENNMGAYAGSKSDNAKGKADSKDFEWGATVGDFFKLLSGDQHKILKTVGVVLLVVMILAWVSEIIFTILAGIPKPVLILFLIFGCGYIIFRKPRLDGKDEEPENKDDKHS